MHRNVCTCNMEEEKMCRKQGRLAGEVPDDDDIVSESGYGKITSLPAQPP